MLRKLAARRGCGLGGRGSLVRTLGMGLMRVQETCAKGVSARSCKLVVYWLRCIGRSVWVMGRSPCREGR